MPTVLLEQGFRFFFYSREGKEPLHIHIEKAEAIGKIWLEPKCEVDYLEGFSGAEKREIERIAQANIELFKMRWHEHFSR